MFNETAYSCGLGDAAAVQRRLDAGRRVKEGKLLKFGLSRTAPSGPGYVTMPAPKGPISSDTGGHTIDMTPGAGAGGGAGSDASSGDSGSGFDLGGIFSAIPWWGWLLGAYFLLKRR